MLVDEDGKRLPPAGTGELVVRGTQRDAGVLEPARGHRRGPQARRRSPARRVLYSGDLFRTDDDGYLYFVGRKDDIIKSRGEKVSPREVENALYGLPGVVEAAVVGVPDAVLGQAVVAYVVRVERLDAHRAGRAPPLRAAISRT